MMLYDKMGIGMMELQNAMLAVQDNTTVKKLTKVMGDDSVSNEKKTSFLLQYLLDQREPLLRFGQTLLIALIVFVIGRKMVKLLLRFTDRWMERRNVEVSVRKFVMSLAGVIFTIDLCGCRYSWRRNQLYCGYGRIGRIGDRPCSAGQFGQFGGWGFDLTPQAVSGWRLYYYATIGGNRTEY